MGLYIKHTNGGHRSTHPSVTNTKLHSQTQTPWDTHTDILEGKEGSLALPHFLACPPKQREKPSPELLSQQRVTNEPWALKSGREHLIRGARVHARPAPVRTSLRGQGGAAVPSLPRGGPREEVTGFDFANADFVAQGHSAGAASQLPAGRWAGLWLALGYCLG